MEEDLSKRNVFLRGKHPSIWLCEIHKYLKKVDGWDVKEDDQKNYYLIKEFNRKFKDSQSFINQVGDRAETENHHPDILWWVVKVKIFTHAIKGWQKAILFISKIDKIIND